VARAAVHLAAHRGHPPAAGVRKAGRIEPGCARRHGPSLDRVMSAPPIASTLDPMQCVAFAVPLLPGQAESDRIALASCQAGVRKEAYQDARRRAARPSLSSASNAFRTAYAGLSNATGGLCPPKA